MQFEAAISLSEVIVHSCMLSQQEVPTNQWAVQLKKEADPERTAESHGFTYKSSIGSLPDHYLFEKKSDTIIGETHPKLEDDPNVLWSERQVTTVISHDGNSG
ncbi:hypothetical protein PROFUN_09955 [Planoprotostelium fungivorum]|uniref:Peptidase S8 pro-domain domain-containing protein n=1 Tax=Planoprotostelium fungivorum TaxID=1890364 RepID=A0A2P6NGC3_9EUKA|nr:hypothetical protein PROFUN_09955 [Planoprotostelium fungivorum]